ncbi:hypothetical protein B0H19DRAFT_1067020 [Mycena capillaripes]|nr:hypothetical protein B0H19DRAFT_1067020 [Mycena capillaripes]
MKLHLNHVVPAVMFFAGLASALVPRHDLTGRGPVLLPRPPNYFKFQPPITAVNIAFSQSGLLALNISDFASDKVFGTARRAYGWKGAPVDLASLFDEPELGRDRTRHNNFTFQHPDSVLATNQTRCPFSAHICKTRPRADLATSTKPEETAHHIMRAGIPYDPEVSPEEAASDTTSTERGLAFVSYQINISAGFRFLQQSFVHQQITLTTGNSFFHLFAIAY